MSLVERATKETEVRVRLRPGSGRFEFQIDAPFFRHMLEALTRYAGFDLEGSATGDLPHHLIEDVAITLGQALRVEVPETCRRYGNATMPMDEALVQVSVDAGGRSYYAGKVPQTMYDHFFRSLADNAGLTLHIRVIRGENRHHIIEACMKAFGLALREAMQEGGTVFSTKGGVRLSIQKEEECSGVV